MQSACCSLLLLTRYLARKALLAAQLSPYELTMVKIGAMRKITKHTYLQTIPRLA